MESSYGMTGDHLWLTSPFHNFTQPTKVSFWIRTKEKESDTFRFDFFVVREDGTLSESVLPDVHQDYNNAGFTQYSFCMPGGFYGVAFQVTLGHSTGYEFSLNDVQVDTSLCSDPVDSGTIMYEMCHQLFYEVTISPNGFELLISMLHP